MICIVLWLFKHANITVKNPDRKVRKIARVVGCGSQTLSVIVIVISYLMLGS